MLSVSWIVLAVACYSGCMLEHPNHPVPIEVLILFEVLIEAIVHGLQHLRLDSRIMQHLAHVFPEFCCLSVIQQSTSWEAQNCASGLRLRVLRGTLPPSQEHRTIIGRNSCKALARIVVLCAESPLLSACNCNWMFLFRMMALLQSHLATTTWLCAGFSLSAVMSFYFSQG